MKKQKSKFLVFGTVLFLNLILYANAKQLESKQNVAKSSTATCDTTRLAPTIKLNGGAIQNTNCIYALVGDSVQLCPVKVSSTDTRNTWLWKTFSGKSYSTQNITLRNLQTNQSGTYYVSYLNSCGIKTTILFHLTVAKRKNGALFGWPGYKTIAYDIRKEYPNLKMPTKNLEDCSGVADSLSSGWWTFRAGPKAKKLVTKAAVQPMLDRLNKDFAYFRDSLGWPPDKRAKNGYRSAVYLYGSGLCADNMDSTALGGWMGSIYFQNQNWPMILASYYPVYSFDPSCPYADRNTQMGGMVHEGIHAILADMPGCKDAAWFQEGGNTWLQQEADARRSNNFSSMGFLNGAAFIAPFMPVECYSGWLQDGSFGGPSAEGVNMFNGSTQICTWRKYLGGTQYGNTFPVFLSQTLGDRSVPWIWKYCTSRVLQGLADSIGDEQIRHLITQYRAKQALIDMGKWTNAVKALVDNNFNVSIGAEWTPSWITPEVWYSTPYAKTTVDSAGWIVPEYRTIPGWSGANQIPLHVTGDTAVVYFNPIGENMTCQLCYRTSTGEAVYGQPVYGGECKIALNKMNINNIVFAVITNTNYKYEGEATRKAHFDYRLKPIKNITYVADNYKKWYNYSTFYHDIPADASFSGVLEDWDGNGDVNITTSFPDSYGWKCSTTSSVWSYANSGIAGTDRYQDNPSGYTYNSASWKGRILYLRWDGSSGATSTAVYSYPVYLYAGKNNTITGKAAWNSVSTAPVLTFKINSLKDNTGTTYASTTVATGAAYALKDMSLSNFTVPTSGLYYLTVTSSTPSLCAVADLGILTTTGVGSALSSKPNVFVNSNNKIVIDVRDDIVNEDAKTAVYKVNGQIIENLRLIKKLTVLDRSFPSGVYIVKVTVKGECYVRKIVVD